MAVFSGGAAVSLPFPVSEEPLVLGRSAAGTGIRLPDDRLSRNHATITLTARGWEIRDDGSRNGTFVDGERVEGRLVLDAKPQVIRLADTLLVPVADLRDVLGDDLVPRPDGMVVSWTLRRALDRVGHAAISSASLFIRGESGSGKELAAREFHAKGPNAKGPFVAVNCATIPAGVAERLLFGAKRGAYSGATADTVGHLQAADGGVLFLDEVAELELSVQAKLLRALESREVTPLGTSTSQRIDVRVVAATHRDLRTAVAEKRFRADLYYRLAPPEVVLPPLRERREEIPRHVLSAILRVSGSLAPHVKLVESAMLRSWPGNVRELRNEIKHAAIRAQDEGTDRVRLEHLSREAGNELRSGTRARSAAPSIPPAEESGKEPRKPRP
ncbi:MAG TPA: sigma 54-interacting transcriptional regulator [Polyangiaceae bacterium]